MIRIKKIHETQSDNQLNKDVNDERIYTPIEDLQKIESGGVFKRNSYDTSKFPKGIRYVGYFLFGGLFLMVLVGITISFIYN